MNKIVISNIRRLVTCAPDGVVGSLTGQDSGKLAVIEGPAAVAVEDGRVKWLGQADNLPDEFRDSETIDVQNQVVTPGLIDCHTHPAFARGRSEEFAMRLAGKSYEEIATAGGGIVNSTNAVRESTDQELANSTARNLRRLRAHGVVVAEGKSGYGLSLKHELRQLEAIKAGGEAADMHTVRTCLAAHSLPMEYRGDAAKREEYLKLVCEEILPAAAKNGLASRADIFCEKGVFSVEDTKRVAEAAAKAGLQMTVHADQLHTFGGAAVAAEIKAHSADHLEFTDAATMQKMKDAGTAAVLLPGATYVLKMNQWANGQAMIEAGLCVALATDFNPGSSPIANPAFIMNLAVMYCGLTPEQALIGFTRNAAHALRLDTQEWGCIQVGSRAAFAVWDVDNEAEIPYYAGSNLCSKVITCEGWRF